MAASELLRRRVARSSCAEFCRYIAPDEPPAAHHALLCDSLDDVATGHLRRLMVFMPPGSAKSTYGSVRFPAYFIGKWPQRSIICASYGENLATSFGRKVRNIVGTDQYQRLFGVSLAPDLKAKGEWETSAGGAYLARGVGSGIAGRRSDLGLIDDPVRGREDADSELIRDRAWGWYLADFLPRLKPGGAQIIIQTRWHVDDLSGRILPDGWNGESGDFEGFDGQTWRVVCLQAEAGANDPLGRKPGEWLWPEWFTPDHWAEVKAAQVAADIRNWASLYQQTPEVESGTFFKREWFNRYRVGDEPKRLSRYGASDYAVTDNGGDFTEHGVAGFDENEDLWLLDWWHGQATADVWIEEELRLAGKHNPICWVAEGGVIRRSVEPFLKKAMRESNYVRIEWIPSNKDKAANARSFQGLAAQGKVWIPRTEWGDRLLDQLVRFIPNTNYQDDGVDVCGLFGRLLDQTYGPRSAKPLERTQRDTYGLDEEHEHDWMTV